VTKSSKGWGVGIKKITTTKHKSFFSNINKFNLIFFHQDQVEKLPKKAKLLACNSFCSIASFLIGDLVLTF
jgi:GMP synthase-like glutamine amidotransferase